MIFPNAWKSSIRTIGFAIPGIEAELAQIYLKMYDGGQALHSIRSAFERDEPDPGLYGVRARAEYLEGSYEAALADARRCAKFGLGNEAKLLLPSQILAAMGQLDEAAKELEGFGGEGRGVSEANLAEAYLAVDPRRTITLLRTRSG